MKTVREVLLLSCSWAQSKNPHVLRRDVELLLAHILQLKRLDLYVQFERPLEELELTQIRQGLGRLVRGEPLQYIEGSVQFCGCKIEVSHHVLIPRQETEEFIVHITKKLEGQNLKGKFLWDICTGSGCIGIAIKKKFPELRVLLSDISNEALDIAKKNARANEVEVEFLHGDKCLHMHHLKADFIISNPPYIAEKEFSVLDSSVRDFEPKLALVAKDEGLEFYRYFATNLNKLLYDNGRAWFEIGSGQKESVQNLFLQNGLFVSQVFHDLSGHARGIEVALKNESIL